MKEYIVTKDILNIRSSPTDIDDKNFIGSLKRGESIFLTDEEMPGKKPDKGGITEVWKRDNMNRFVAMDGLREKNYDDKKQEFINDTFNEKYIDINDKANESKWKVDWGIVDLEIWKLWKKGFSGQKVKVAVIDSGINSSIKDITNAIADQSQDIKSFIPGTTIIDDLGHGTNCASIIASQGIQLVGAAPACNLIIGKIESKAVGKTPKIVLEALKWACEDRKADIISLSFSFPSEDSSPQDPDEQVIADYIKKMHYENNKLFVASIGNLGEDAKDFYSFPANYTGCVSIGAYGHDRIIWDGSSWNNNLTFAAPGVDLQAYNLTGGIDTLQPATSYSCPYAAAILANMLSYYKAGNIPFKAPEFISSLKYDHPPTYDRLKFGNGIIIPQIV